MPQDTNEAPSRYTMAVDPCRLRGRIRLAQPRGLEAVTSLYLQQSTLVPDIAWRYPYWETTDACFCAYRRTLRDGLEETISNHEEPDADRFVTLYENQAGVVTGLISWRVWHRVLNGGTEPKRRFTIEVGQRDMVQIRQQAREKEPELRGRDDVYEDVFRDTVMSLYHQRAERRMLGTSARNGARNGLVTVEMVCVTQEQKAMGVGAELVAFAVASSRREDYYVRMDVSDRGIHGWLAKLGFVQFSATTLISPGVYDQVDRRQTVSMAVWALVPGKKVQVKIAGVWQDQPDSERAAF
ncbi:hypothetical protein MAPG_04830 [Magnaporthiopsis poae ATCC 64411]|uniref:N-acetyltransferase domain-containing protein n=1 Tax=Magnaporthiopsis poae (strain ATCC 64411 / 73-15) TaxID=644358 RepID=A0A0C4DXS3_MAGP6|nr:hypothetical protein MAPG_04830 [Magnaporthiopsis poae ATCC 64411]